MNKLKLAIEALEVESFSVAAEKAPAGTVRGLQYSSAGPRECNDACYSDPPCYSAPPCYSNPPCYSDPPCDSYDPSCQDTCNATCEYSCLCMSEVVACITQGGEPC